MTIQKFYTVKQFSSFNNIKEGTVRNWIFQSEEIGFNKCIYRIGRKILISQEKFEIWMEGNPESTEVDGVASEKMIKKYLEINKYISTLGDKDLGELFEYLGID